ncbi:MAG: hypothetical protein ACHQIM_19730 [Sphingobacteriales bacterium]
MDVNSAQLGLKGKVAVRDLWEKEDAGTFKNRYKKTNQYTRGCSGKSLLKH